MGSRSAPIGTPTSGVLVSYFSNLLLFQSESHFGADSHIGREMIVETAAIPVVSEFEHLHTALADIWLPRHRHGRIRRAWTCAFQRGRL
jgi:hypothetical protein